ncbi:hypothetical protein EB796_009860 [Bugula neritina]|uniref:Uncharacterized protein n=1 Tax=Bugula neritina TaxID=10212 RepID=A0A7J7K110_BUGNE|nr:hypothetical protein EB796_009860 [Bugula neritina]
MEESFEIQRRKFYEEQSAFQEQQQSEFLEREHRLTTQQQQLQQQLEDFRNLTLGQRSTNDANVMPEPTPPPRTRLPPPVTPRKTSRRQLHEQPAPTPTNTTLEFTSSYPTLLINDHQNLITHQSKA